MSILKAIRIGFERSFDFEGRSSRTEYWYWELFWFSSVLGLYYLFFELSILFIMITFIPQSSMNIRRLHDLNKSGWWILLWSIPVMLFFKPVIPIELMIVVCVVVFLFLLWFSRSGDQLMNRYGDNPQSKYYYLTQE